MRKHDVRKWLHAILDLLPVILIPVFMIYSHRHDVTERTDVDVTYKYQSNEVNTENDLVNGNIYYNAYLPIHDDNLGTFDFSITILHYELENSEDLENVSFDENSNIPLIYDGCNCDLQATHISGTNYSFFLYFYTNVEEDTYIAYDLGQGLYFKNVIYQIQDVDDFWNYLNQQIIGEYDSRITLPQYTDYNVIESVEINDTNSSVMNVFMDDFNNSIDKYFNMGNVFNLSGVYQWFNTNIFSGNAPTIIYSIWNIALYELVMDLLFLLYGLFMWFIDMIQKLMEKPLNSVR